MNKRIKKKIKFRNKKKTTAIVAPFVIEPGCYKAWIKGYTGIWGWGKTILSALRDLRKTAPSHGYRVKNYIYQGTPEK